MSFLSSGSLWSCLYCGVSSLCVGLYRWLVKVSWLGKLVSVFWWVELFLLSPFEDLGCFSGCLMSSASFQKLFCGIYSAFKCSFDEFVGEKVFSPSYSSAILAPPLLPSFKKTGMASSHIEDFFLISLKSSSTASKCCQATDRQLVSTVWNSLNLATENI